MHLVAFEHEGVLPSTIFNTVFINARAESVAWPLRTDAITATGRVTWLSTPTASSWFKVPEYPNLEELYEISAC
jgi:hypothetical protein